MARTNVKTNQIGDGEVTRDDLNTATTGKAVVRKIVQGTGTALSATGADSGTGDVTVGLDFASLTAKSTPVDADVLPLADSAASNAVKKVTWSNIKTTLKSYLDTFYQAVLVSGTNIKTINGSSILGSGDLTVSGGMTVLASKYSQSINYALTTTMADINATEAVVTFTAPASGKVLVTFKGVWLPAAGTSSVLPLIGLRTGSTNETNSAKIPEGVQFALDSTDAEFTIDNKPHQISYQFLLTGLTPGNSYTYKAAAKDNTGSTSSSIKADSTYGSSEMIAWSV
jgi:hypothetical protein